MAAIPDKDKVTSGYNVAQVWERFAPLSFEQQNVLDLLSQPCSRWPFEEDQVEVAGKEESISGNGRESDEKHLVNNTGEVLTSCDQFVSAHEFYKWFADVETSFLSEREMVYTQYADTLKQQGAALNDILSTIDAALTSYDDLKLQQLKVKGRVNSVQATCDRLERERENLENFAEEIANKLSFFDLHQIETTGIKDKTSVVEMLGKIEDGIAYLTSHTQYLSSATYLTKYRALQHKALSSVKEYTQNAFTTATNVVLDAASTRNTATGIEMALLDVKFKAAVPDDLQKVIGAIQLRLSRQDYSRLMHDIQRFYSEKRIEVLSEAVEEHLMNYQSSNELPMLIRLGCAYLIQLTQMEYQLFRYFFPSSDCEALKLVITPLCTILYEIVRPYFIAMYDITSLCSIVSILKAEILDEQFGSEKGEALSAMRPVIEEILADVQERLVYSMQHYIRDEIAYYTPTKEDLTFGESKEEEDKEKEKNGEQKAADFTNLYPAVQNTLLCLSKTYSCLELKTFGGLAQEVIQYCTDSCIVASQEIAKASGLLMSQLFLIKNLLALREQLSLFDVDFGSQETELDFSHMRDHLRRILRGESSLFALGASNAVFQLIGNARPRISKTHFDSKRELEKKLKVACESYIMGVTKLSVEPMLSFITKVTTTRVASTKKALKDHAFATPSKLIEIVTTVNTALEDTLPKAIGKMKKCLDSTNTQLVLFKPIKSNIAEAHGQIAHLLESEYDSETIKMVPLMPPSKLMAILDSLS